MFSDAEFMSGISASPFIVLSIYVVGGQVDFLPSRFNVGEHDLDLRFRTNARDVCKNRGMDGVFSHHLSSFLNDGRYFNSLMPKKYVIHIMDSYGLHSPYLQVYPQLDRVV